MKKYTHPHCIRIFNKLLDLTFDVLFIFLPTPLKEDALSKFPCPS